MIEKVLTKTIAEAFKKIYDADLPESIIQIQDTRKDFDGDKTIVIFPLLKFSKKSPGETARDIGSFLQENIPEIATSNIIKGFLNISFEDAFWMKRFQEEINREDFGSNTGNRNQHPVLVEYSSPNTNKPLHLGHIRNNLIGHSISNLLETTGHPVVKTNIVNDRGIHICKSMLAWEKWGDGETPETSGKKGDHLVGEYYVRFDLEYKQEVAELMEQGMGEDKALKNASLLKEAQDMLLKWEKGDPGVLRLWKTMNSWVYDGFDKTYKKLGVEFDKIYYESETFRPGKELVHDALQKGILFRKEDGSVWADLSDEGLDEKLLIRSDGTAVYMTQDLGTAVERFNDYNFSKHIYVVGNEQNYHFQVLKVILKKLGYDWADSLFHLSYGMVELPEGKMKSREGTVVDADDLMDEMIDTAQTMSEELGKLDEFNETEKNEIYRIVGLGALKYFILKVDPKKNMTFDPKESIDFNGNTGPFIQYAYARIQSVLRKANERGITLESGFRTDMALQPKEKDLIKLHCLYHDTLIEAGENLNPALIANYTYELVKEYNQFYHDFSILGEPDETIRTFRIKLSHHTGRVIKSAMNLLGIEVPERM